MAVCSPAPWLKKRLHISHQPDPARSGSLTPTSRAFFNAVVMSMWQRPLWSAFQTHKKRFQNQRRAMIRQATLIAVYEEPSLAGDGHETAYKIASVLNGLPSLREHGLV